MKGRTSFNYNSKSLDPLASMVGRCNWIIIDITHNYGFQLETFLKVLSFPLPTFRISRQGFFYARGFFFCITWSRPQNDQLWSRIGVQLKLVWWFRFMVVPLFWLLEIVFKFRVCKCYLNQFVNLLHSTVEILILSLVSMRNSTGQLLNFCLFYVVLLLFCCWLVKTF